MRRKIRLWMTSGVWRNHCRMDRPVYVSLAEIGTHFSTWKAIGVTSRRLYMTSITAFQVTEATASTIFGPCFWSSQGSRQESGPSEGPASWRDPCDRPSPAKGPCRRRKSEAFGGRVPLTKYTRKNLDHFDLRPWVLYLSS